MKLGGGKRLLVSILLVLSENTEAFTVNVLRGTLPSLFPLTCLRCRTHMSSGLDRGVSRPDQHSGRSSFVSTSMKMDDRDVTFDEQHPAESSSSLWATHTSQYKMPVCITGKIYTSIDAAADPDVIGTQSIDP